MKAVVALESDEQISFIVSVQFIVEVQACLDGLERLQEFVGQADFLGFDSDVLEIEKDRY